MILYELSDGANPSLSKLLLIMVFMLVIESSQGGPLWMSAGDSWFEISDLSVRDLKTLSEALSVSVSLSLSLSFSLLLSLMPLSGVSQ